MNLKIFMLAILLVSFNSYRASASDEYELNLEEGTQFVNAPIKRDDTIVSIGGIARVLNKSTSCDSGGWGNNVENSCQCCIVKHFLQNEGPKKTIDYCVQEKKYCTSNGILSIAQKLTGISPRDDLQAASNINQAVNKLPLVDTSPRMPPGLSERDLITLLSKAEQESYLKLPGTKNISSNPQCYQVKILSDKGANTLQLFLLSVAPSCQENKDQAGYIIKEIKNVNNEVRNLLEVEQKFKEIDPENFKNIMLPIMNFTYVDTNNNKHSLSVLPLAPGKSLKTWLDEYYASPSQEKKNILENIFFNVGTAMAKIHLKHMQPSEAIFGNTWNHGDAHLANVFATADGNISFIDNETFAKYLNSPQAPDKDLLQFFLLSSVSSNEHTGVPKANLSTPAGIEEWLNLTLEPFLKGYVHEYVTKLGANRKTELTKALKKVFLDYGIVAMAKLGRVVNLLTYNKFKPSIEKIIDRL